MAPWSKRPRATTAARCITRPNCCLNDMEQKVLDAIRCEATSIDEIVVHSGLPMPQVLATLSVLEMRHLIRRLSGTTVIRL